MPLTTEEDHDCLGGLGPQCEEGLGQLTLGTSEPLRSRLGGMGGTSATFEVGLSLLAWAS